ncbi:acetate--CoA ligase family protein [Corticibacterium sp. UT-5YL-CI-8]|nr:acetate--CoA ligase family protein [Tianweitania sp. UT-5YL-CI-8]
MNTNVVGVAPEGGQAQLSKEFFWPDSMAFIGATSDLTTIRGRLFAFSYKNGFKGDLYPVNPTHQEIGGFKSYPSITAIGKPVDLAVIAIPAKSVPDVVQECAEAGVKNVLIIASGFAEEGGDASNLQDRLVDISRRTGIRIAGPNSEGVFNAVGSISATFSPVVESLAGQEVIEAAPNRRIGVVSQSGGMGYAMFIRGRALGLSFSYIVSSGNEVDLSAADYLDYMVRDPNTQIIILLCESIRDGERFKQAAAAAERAGKPIVMVKLGRSDAGSRAAKSHTASLTGSHSAYRAIFRRYGIIEAAEMDEAVNIAAALACCPLPKGRRVGVVTASGGGGTTTADVYSAHGLVLPVLSERLQAEIRTLIPPHATAQNPIDTTAQGHRTGPVSMRCVELLDESGEVDMITIIVSAARETSVSLIGEKIKAVTDRGKTPVIIWTYTLASQLSRRVAASGGTVVLTDIRHCALALSKLAGYAEHVANVRDEPEPTLKAIARPAGVAKALAEHRVKQLLSNYGLGGENDRLVDSAGAAAEAACELGFPVVLKIQSPDILHKTEVGGVKVGLTDADAVSKAYSAIIASAKALVPKAVIEGVLVQRMAPKGPEIVVGMVNDVTFGPIMMIGFGGIAVELFEDVVHYPAPISVSKAKELLLGLKSAPLFNGFRGAPKIDVTPAAELIARISQAALAGKDFIQEMEFNPIILHADGSGATVADAVLILKQ